MNSNQFNQHNPYQNQTNMQQGFGGVPSSGMPSMAHQQQQQQQQQQQHHQQYQQQGYGFGGGSMGMGMNMGFGNNGNNMNNVTGTNTGMNANSGGPYMTQPQQVGFGGNSASTSSVTYLKSSGLLPSSILQKLDQLIDRINASSGYGYSASANGAGAAAAAADTNHKKTTNKATATTVPLPVPVAATTPPPVRIICIGTNEGIPLSRSYGSASSTLNNHLNEETLSILETVWNTVPSSVAPHVMTNSIAHHYQQQQQQQSPSPLQFQPPHPLLRHIGMGPILKSTTVYYENCTFIQYHYAPLVITIVASPPSTPSMPSTPHGGGGGGANIGYIKSVALPVLKELLEPIRQIVLKRRIDLSMVLSNSNSASTNDSNNNNTSNGNNSNDRGNRSNNGSVIGVGGNSSVNMNININIPTPPLHNHHQMIGLSVAGNGVGHQGDSAGSGLNSYG